MQWNREKGHTIHVCARKFHERCGSPTIVIRGTAWRDQNTIHDNFENSRRQATHYLRKRGYSRSIRELRRNTLDSNCICLTRLSPVAPRDPRVHMYRISFRPLYSFVLPLLWTTPPDANFAAKSFIDDETEIDKSPIEAGFPFLNSAWLGVSLCRADF